MIIDLFLIIVLAYGFYTGYHQGIIKTIFTILGVGFGLLAALRYTPVVTRLYYDIFNQSGSLWLVAGFATTFLLALLFLKIIGKGIESIMEKVHLNFINQVIGGIILAGISAFFYSLIVWFVVESILSPQSQSVTSSKTYTFLRNYPGQVWQGVIKLKPLVGDFKEFSEDIFNKVEEKTNSSEEKKINNDSPAEE